mgnify:FL=1
MYTLFQCIECKSLVAYPKNTADGYKCTHCNGMLKAINNGTKEELRGRYIADIEFPTDRKKRCNHSITINMERKDIEDISVGLRLVDMFRWRDERINFDSILESDKDTKDIIIKESDLLKAIKLVNPYQKDRNIVIAKDNDCKQ